MAAAYVRRGTRDGTDEGLTVHLRSWYEHTEAVAPAASNCLEHGVT
jgi:hypothetical protein